MAEINRRTTLVNSIRAILAFVKGNDFAGASLERAQINLRNLNRHFATFTDIHNLLIGGNIPQMEFDAHEQLRATIQDEVIEIEELLTQKIQQLQRANQPAPAVIQPPPAQPQVIQIEGINRLLAQKLENVWGEFDGTLWKWAQFKDLFRAAVHENNHLSGAQKFQHLLKSLTGDAKEALGNWQVTDANYQLAYERLCNLYDRPQQAATELMNRMFELETLKHASSKGLQHLSNVANDVKRQMTALNYNTEHWDVMFITILQKKLDYESKKAWEIHKDPVNPTLNDMLTFIENRARVWANLKMEAESTKDNRGFKENRKRFGDRQNYHNPPKRPFIPSSVEQTSRPASNRIPCAFCNSTSHLTYLCDGFVKKGLPDRKKMIKSKGLCLSCLRPGHLASFCPKGACFKCNEKHNISICPVNPSIPKTNNVMSTSVKAEKRRPKSNRS